MSESVVDIVWWTFPIAEVLTAVISIFILKSSYRERIENMKEEKATDHLIISISREHGTNGKEIARLVAKELKIPFYDKEEIMTFAVKNKLAKTEYTEKDLYDNYLSLDASSDAIIHQTKVIKKIAEKESAVIVGRSADYILRNNPNLIKIFIYAPMDYKVGNVMKNYHDSEKEAKKHILESNKARSTYYSVIANQTWGDKSNYDLCIDASLGNEFVVKMICEYIRNRS